MDDSSGMQNYDATLKLLFRALARVAMREITGATIQHWHDVELPNPQNLRVDLLGETADRTLVHIELQSAHDDGIPMRMAEYGIAIHKLFGRFPRQLCLYLGRPRMRMRRQWREATLSYEYELLDIRELDGEPLLESPHVGDNLIAILARLRDHRDAVRRILSRIEALPHGAGKRHCTS
jgi:hypothetical protein